MSNRLFARRELSIAVLLLLVVSSLGVFVAPVTSQTEEQNGEGDGTASPPPSSLIVTESDYTTPTDFVFGSAVAYVVLTDKESDTTPQREILHNLTASSSEGSVTFDVVETGPETGVFAGSFGFTNQTQVEGTANGIFGRIMGDARLKVSAGSTVTIQSNEPALNATVTWFPATSGSLADFENLARTDVWENNKPILGWQRSVYYRITDSDLNLDPAGPDSWDDLFRVYSDSDLEGEFLLLTESGPNTGVFHATAGFEQTLTADNDLVFARSGDNIYAEYTDLAGSDGRRALVERRPALAFLSATDGELVLSRTTVFGETGTMAKDLDRTTLLVFDPDRDVSLLSEAIAVTMKREGTVVCGSGDKPLFQLGGVDGAYFITFGFRATGPTCVRDEADGTYFLPLGGITARQTFSFDYLDERDESGVNRTRTATLAWLPLDTGEIFLGASGTNPVMRLAGTANAVNVQLDDHDRDLNSTQRDTVSVKIKSTSDPINGVPVTLMETTEASHVFVGSFGFTTSASGGGLLQVADRDIVVAVYEDPVGALGLPMRVTSQEVVWRAAAASVITSGSGDTIFYADRAGNADPESEARFILEDPDQNDPRIRDTIQVAAFLRTNPGAPPVSQNFTMLEVGVDSGTFFGVLNFTISGAAGRLNVGAGQIEKFYIEFADPTGADGRPARTTSNEFTWRKIGGDVATAPKFVRMEYDDGIAWRPRDQLPMQIPYTDPNAANTDHPEFRTYSVVVYSAPSAAPIPVLVSSSRCPEPKSFNAIDGNEDGRYTVNIVFVSLIASHGCYSTPDPEVNTNNNFNAGDLEVGVTRTATITIQVAGEGQAARYEAETKAFSGGGSRFTKLDPTQELGGGALNGIGQVQATFVRTSGSVGDDDDTDARTGGIDNLHRSIRDVKRAVSISSEQSPGFKMFQLETAANSNEFVSSFHHTSANTDIAGLKLAVRSELQGSPRHYDTVVVSEPSFAGQGRGGDRYSWYDSKSPTLSVLNSAAGPQGRFALSLSGDDLLTDRIMKESIQTAANQRLFALSRPFVPGSERVYIDRIDPVAAPPTQTQVPVTTRTVGGVTVTQSGLSSPPPTHAVHASQAAERIVDINDDLRWNCFDVSPAGHFAQDPDSLPAGFTCPPGPTPTGVTSVNPSSGVVYWVCSAPGCEVDRLGYRYRLAHGTQTDEFRYTRAGENQLRLGGPIPPVLTANADPKDLGAEITQPRTVYVDYTPDQKVTVIAPGETEVVRLKWDQATLSYRGEVQVETSKTPNNGRIYVGGSNADVKFRFDDPYLADGRPSSANPDHFRSIAAIGSWRAGSDPTITFYDPEFSQAKTQQVFGPGVPVEVIDKDQDRTNHQDALFVRATNEANQGLFRDVLLREISVKAGVFRGYIDVSGLGFPLIGANAGGTLLVRYTDPMLANGASGARVARIDWRPSATANLTLWRNIGLTEAAGIQPASMIVGTDGAMYARVIDPDQNLDPAVVDRVLALAVSDGDPEGEVVALEEDGVNSGSFRSAAIRFESRPLPGNGRVYAEDRGTTGDQIRVLYVDPVNANGRQSLLRSSPTRWDRTFDGAVDVEARYYVGTYANATQGLGGTRGIGILTVADGDCNLDPYVVNTIGATAPTGSACPTIGGTTSALRLGVLTPAGALTGLQAVTQLVETGANTGVFMGRFSFSGDASDAGGQQDARPARLLVVNGDRIRAEYTDPRSATGGAATLPFTDEAQWFQAGFGIVEFDRPGYRDFGDRPLLRLIDSDLTGTGNATITLRSETDTTGIQVTVVEDQPGMFEQRVSLSETSSTTNQIRVGLSDKLFATYADASPVGQRTTEAIIGIGEVTPPTTRLVTDPEEGDLLRGAFSEPATVSFAANKDVSATFFRLGTEGANQTYTQPFTLSEGAYQVTFWSVDVFGNIEQPKLEFVVIDTKPPKDVVKGVSGRPAPGGAVNLSWSSVLSRGSLEDFYDYVIFRSDTDHPIGNTTSENFTDPGTGSEEPVTYRVAARDYAGYKGPNSTAVTVTPDATQPLVDNLAATPNTFDVRALPAEGLAVSVKASDTNLELVRVALVAPNGTRLAEAELAPTEADAFGGILDVSALMEPCGCTLRAEAVDAAGNVGVQEVSYIVEGLDALAPEFTAELPDTLEVGVGGKIAVKASDNVRLGAVSYQLDSLPAVTVALDPDTPALVTFDVPVGLILGGHNLTVNAVDQAKDAAGAPAPNAGEKTFAFLVVSQAGGSGGATSYFLNVTTETKDGKIVVKWRPPAGVDVALIGGYQVWRSSSPYVLLTDVPGGTSTSFTDGSVDEGKTYRYAVTFYDSQGVGKVKQLSALPGYTSDDSVPSSDPTEVAKGGVPSWVWFLIGGVVLVAIAVIVVLVVVRRKPPPKQETPPPQGG